MQKIRKYEQRKRKKEEHGPNEGIGGAFNGEIDDAAGESSQEAGMAEAVASSKGVKLGTGNVGEGSVEREMVGGGGRRAGAGAGDDEGGYGGDEAKEEAHIFGGYFGSGI